MKIILSFAKLLYWFLSTFSFHTSFFFINFSLSWDHHQPKKKNIKLFNEHLLSFMHLIAKNLNYNFPLSLYFNQTFYNGWFTSFYQVPKESSSFPNSLYERMSNFPFSFCCGISNPSICKIYFIIFEIA